MHYKDFREWLDVLDKNGLLQRVSREVDASWEIGTITRTAFEDTPEPYRYGIMWEKVKGKKFRAATNVLCPSRKQVELAIGVPYERRLEKGVYALTHQTEPQYMPKQVSWGPCKENILKGDQINLFDFPFITWHPSNAENPNLDGAPFHTSGLAITMEYESKVQNMGVYRSDMGQGKNFFTCNIGRPGQHGGMNLASWEAHGKPTMPIALAIGNDPVVGMCGALLQPYPFDELRVAGALKGEAIPVVKCETNDLWVPANSEIIIEGEITRSDTVKEALTGESAGYVLPGPFQKLVFRVKCITHRNDAIYNSIMAAKGPNEASYYYSTLHDAGMFKHLTIDHHIKGISEITFAKGTGFYHLFIRMKKGNAGSVMYAMMTATTFAPPFCKYITVVDDDVDIQRLDQVEWAMAFHCQPARDIVIIPNTPIGSQDMSTAGPGEIWRKAPSSKMLIDATRKWEYPPVAWPPKEFMDKVRNQWQEYGLPKLLK